MLVSKNKDVRSCLPFNVVSNSIHVVVAWQLLIYVFQMWGFDGLIQHKDLLWPNTKTKALPLLACFPSFDLRSREKISKLKRSYRGNGRWKINVKIIICHILTLSHSLFAPETQSCTSSMQSFFMSVCGDFFHYIYTDKLRI